MRAVLFFVGFILCACSFEKRLKERPPFSQSGHPDGFVYELQDGFDYSNLTSVLTSSSLAQTEIGLATKDPNLGCYYNGKALYVEGDGGVASFAVSRVMNESQYLFFYFSDNPDIGFVTKVKVEKRDGFLLAVESQVLGEQVMGVLREDFNGLSKKVL